LNGIQEVAGSIPAGSTTSSRTLDDSSTTDDDDRVAREIVAIAMIPSA
jgi:hypothetical protein